MKETAVPILKVIEGGRKHLESAVMKQMAEGNLSPALVERLEPKGKLHLVYSRPIISKQEEDYWLNFEDLNI